MDPSKVQLDTVKVSDAPTLMNLGKEVEPPDYEDHDVINAMREGDGNHDLIDGEGNHDLINARGGVTEDNGGGHDLIQKLVEQFEQRLDQEGEELNAAFEAHDYEAAHRKKEI